jgi:hypothetical protein
MMLIGHRRYFAAAAFLVLAAPLAVGLLRPDSAASVLREGRRPAPEPALPASLSDLAGWPGAADAYLKDRFGLRQALLHAYRELTRPMFGFGGGTSVLIGRDGRMFYLGDQMVRQSAGLVMRDERVAESIDLVAEIAATLERKGVRFLVAAPPNASTIYQDDLPAWAQKGGRDTEYDLYLRELRARGVRTVDLRPPILAARAEGEVFYRRDSHWTFRGAIAAFNAAAEADGHPDWRIDAEAALGPPVAQAGGDLARMLGGQESDTETVRMLALPPVGKAATLTSGLTPDIEIATGRHATVLIIGDSFTESFFPPLLAEHVGRAIWMHVHECRFDWSAVERYRPDEVWWMPTERALVCDPGARPQNFSAEAAVAK